MCVALMRSSLRSLWRPPLLFFFFFNDTATTEIYTLSLHDALPISNADWERMWGAGRGMRGGHAAVADQGAGMSAFHREDRKSTRLNSSHSQISYAVFCLKKKNKTRSTTVFNTSGHRKRHSVAVHPH